MEKAFSYIKDLMDDILLKEQDLENVKKDLERIKKEKEQNMNLLCDINASISRILLDEEEREEILKFTILPYGLIFLFLIVLFILFSTKAFTFKILIFIIPIILSFPISNILVKKAKKKYTKLREEQYQLVEDKNRKKDKLLDERKELNAKEDSLQALFTKLETDINSKKEYLNKLQSDIILSLAPTLDRLIEEEISQNNNTELKEILNRIREI